MPIDGSWLRSNEHFFCSYTGSSVWDVRKVKHYTQETMKVHCLLMVHTCVGESGACATAH